MAAPSAAYPTSALVAQMVAEELKNQCPLVRYSDREWSSQFTQDYYKPGQSINLQLDYRNTVQKGLTVSAEAIVSRQVSLTLQQPYNIAIQYDVVNQKLSTPMDTLRNLIKNNVNRLVAQLESDMFTFVANNAYMTINNTGGTGFIDTYAKYQAASTRLFSNGVPMNDWFQVMSGPSYDSLAASSGGLLNQFVTSSNENIRANNEIPHLGDFDTYKSQNVIYHTAGAAGAGTGGAGPFTVLANYSTGTSVSLAGFSNSITNLFLPGDRITFVGIKALNFVNMQPTTYDYTAVVAAAANSDGSGHCTVTLVQALDTNTDDPNRNLNALIPAGTVVTVLPSYRANTAYQRRGMILVLPPMSEIDGAINSRITDEETGMSLSVTMQGSVTSYTNVMRISFLPGFCIIPDYVAVNASLY